MLRKYKVYTEGYTTKKSVYKHRITDVRYQIKTACPKLAKVSVKTFFGNLVISVVQITGQCHEILRNGSFG
jgi:hypothetical protein